MSNPDDSAEKTCRECGAKQDEPCERGCGCAACRQREFDAQDAREAMNLPVDGKEAG